MDADTVTRGQPSPSSLTATLALDLFFTLSRLQDQCITLNAMNRFSNGAALLHQYFLVQNLTSCVWM